MDAVASWTGSKADTLRQALRMTNEAFAEYLGVAVRTVAYWRQRPDVVPRPAMQEALDTALERAPARVKSQFNLLIEQRQATDCRKPAGTSSLWRTNTNDLDGQLSPDDESRLEGVEHHPARLAARAVESLAQVLVSQRRLEDAIGPAAVLRPATAQMDVMSKMLRDATGPHRDALAHVVAEWTSFVGWLTTALRRDDKALALFKQAEDLADEVGNGVIASTSISFQGYVARLQGRPRRVIRASAAALATPGVHRTQQVFDMLQTAEAYADMGDKEQARNFLDQASNLAGSAGNPPSSVYWYTEPFFRLNIGLTQLSIGDYRA